MVVVVVYNKTQLLGLIICWTWCDFGPDLQTLSKYLFRKNVTTACQHSYCCGYALLLLRSGSDTAPRSTKTCHFYFLNGFVKHWPILIIFGVQHQEEI